MPNWQPHLSGKLIELRPMVEEDFEALYSAASDPMIWEQHPDRHRYTRERFERFFRSGMDSKGALIIADKTNGSVIGSSRYCNWDKERNYIEVGFTFLARKYWARGYNDELKILMLDHGFQYVDVIGFYVGENNFRSQKAVLKLGAIEVKRDSSHQVGGEIRSSVVYELNKQLWIAKRTG
jgi:RimJ/RimL family protein N-acetyltransferase